MKHLLILPVLLFCYNIVTFAQYSGQVFVDTNGNGIYDKGEKLLENVAVSDGKQVVLTDRKGRFELPGHDKQKFIFVTTPSGYKTVGTHYHPIESADRTYNFAMQLWKQGIQKDASHSFIQITDTEIFNTAGHEDWVGNIRDYAANEQIAFIIHTGDICYEKGLQNHIQLMNTENMNCPVFYCIGNHDLVEGPYGEHLFESLYGPVYYSFDVGNTHYIITPMPDGDHTPSYQMEDVWKWVENDIAVAGKGKPIILFNHDLLPFQKSGLNKYDLKAWIYGHWHINYMKKIDDMVTVCTATLDKGGIDHSTSAYRVIHVDNKSNITSDLRYTYIKNHLEINSLHNSCFPVGENGNLQLSVNTYSSVSPVRKVEYKIVTPGNKMIDRGSLNPQTDWSWNTEVEGKKIKEGIEYLVHVETTFNDGTKAVCKKNFHSGTKIPGVKLSGNWNNLGGNARHTGWVESSFDGSASLAWVKNVGANIFMSSPLIHKEKVFVATVDENLKGEGAILALDGYTGDIKWKYPVRNSIKNTIAIEDDLLFAQDAEGYLYAIDTETGHLAWERKLNVNLVPAVVDGLVATNGVIVAGAGRGLTALDGKTGTVLWENQAWEQGEGTTSTLACTHNILIAGAQWKGLYAHKAQTGELLWKHTKEGLNNRGASPAIHNGLMYIISGTSFFIIEIESGNIIVRKELQVKVDVTSTPLLIGNRIVFGTATDGLMALDRETLEEVWRIPMGQGLIYTSPYTRMAASTVETSPVGIGKYIVVGGSDGVIYCIEHTSGEIMWTHTTGSPVFSSAAVAGNTCVLSDFGGNIYAFIMNE